MFFLKKKLLLFQILRQKRSEKGKFFRLCSLNCIIPDRKNGLRKFFLRFEDLFCHFWIFIKNKSERFSKLLSMSLEDRFGKKSFFFKICSFFLCFSELSRTFPGLLAKQNFGMVATFPLDEPRGTFWGEQCFQRNKFFRFHTLSQKRSKNCKTF